MKDLLLKKNLENLRNDLRTEFQQGLKALRFEFKEDLLDMEDRINMRTNKRIDHLENDMEKVKTKLKLA